MSDVALSQDLVGELTAKGSIDAEDVLRLRREVFGDGVVSWDEADTIFQLDRGCGAKDPSWTEFYVDALADYFVHGAQPPKYVSEENADALIAEITRDGRIGGAGELELLIKVIDRAQSCPDRLVAFVLEAVKQSVLDPDSAVYRPDRRPHMVDASDVDMLRKVLYGGASGGGFTITQREAELLFEINDATVAADNDPGWRELFAKAVGNYLMFPRSAPVVPSAEEQIRREARMNQRRGTGSILGQMGRMLVGGRFGEAWRDADMFGKRQAAEAATAEAAEAHAAADRERIDETEARWLIARIDGDGMLHENERALLEFIREVAPRIHPSLEDLMAKTGV